MMPSPQFIKSYFSSFTDDIISQPLQKGEKKDEDKDKEGEAAEVTERSENLTLEMFHRDLCPCVDLTVFKIITQPFHVQSLIFLVPY